MLSYMRRNAGSWMIKVLLAGVALSFVIGFGVLPSLRNKGDSNVVARVGERVITRGEWEEAYENLVQMYRRVYQDRFSEEMVKQLRLRESALDNLINRILQLQEANRLGLGVSDEDLQERIRSRPYFKRDGQFDRDLYLRRLSLARITPAEFERQQREDLMLEDLQEIIRGTVKISELELWNQYVLEEDKVDLDVLSILPRNMEKDVTFKEQDLRDYFADNTDRFLTEEKVKAAYVQFSPATYRDEVRVYTGDVEDYYNSHIEEFSTPEELRLRHILLRVSPDADPSVRSEKRAKLEGILERARAGESFEQLAEAYSDDASAKKGGDLGYVKRGQLLPEVEKVAFSLKPGEVSDIVSSSYGLHILKVEDYREAKVAPLEEVKEKIREKLIEEASWRRARRHAEEFLWDVREHGKFAPAGSSEKPAAAVRETEFFARGKVVPGLGKDPAFADAAFALDAGAFSDVVKGENAYYIIKLLERKPPEKPAFEDVKKEVERAYRTSRSRELAEEKAAELVDRLKQGASMAEIAEKEKLRTFTTGPFSRLRSYIPRIGSSEDLLEAAFGLTAQRPVPDRAFEVNGRFFVVRLKERIAPTREGFEAGMAALREKQERAKTQEVYREWLAELRKQRDVKVSPQAI